jgi:hypothetical protein
MIEGPEVPPIRVCLERNAPMFQRGLRLNEATVPATYARPPMNTNAHRALTAARSSGKKEGREVAQKSQDKSLVNTLHLMV